MTEAELLAIGQAEKKCRAECKRLRALLSASEAAKVEETARFKVQETLFSELEQRNVQLQGQIPPMKALAVCAASQTDSPSVRGGGSGEATPVMENVKNILNLTDAEYDALITSK